MNMTRKQKETILKAWRSLSRLCQTRNWHDANELSEALRIEKQERGGSGAIHNARALILRCFADGYRNPDMPAKDLYGISRGCRTATIMGADYRREVDSQRERYGDKKLASGYTPLHQRVDFDALLAQCDAASQANHDACNAALDKISL